MIAIVISLNLAIACLCLSIVWKLKQLRRILRRWTRALIVAEQNTDRVLCCAPYYILMGQSGTHQFRQHLLDLEPLRRKILHLSTLMGFLQWVQRPQAWRSRLGRVALSANRLKRE